MGRGKAQGVASALLYGDIFRRKTAALGDGAAQDALLLSYFLIKLSSDRDQFFDETISGHDLGLKYGQIGLGKEESRATDEHFGKCLAALEKEGLMEVDQASVEAYEEQRFHRYRLTELGEDKGRALNIAEGALKT